MLRLWIIAALASLAVMPPRAIADDYSDCYQLRDPALSIRSCTKILQRGKRQNRGVRLRALYCRGHSFALKQQYKLALSDFTNCIKLSATDTRCYIGRGFVYEKLGNNDKALVDYVKATKLNPNSSVAYYNAGNIYTKKKPDKLKQIQIYYEKSIKSYSKAIRLNRKYIDAYYNRGQAHYSHLFISRLSKTIEPPKGKTLSQFHRDLASLALSDFNQVIRLSPNNPRGYRARGSVYLLVGSRKKAAVDFKKADSLERKR
jgi:tetratricopeptide (TPR) repeat protein